MDFFFFLAVKFGEQWAGEGLALEAREGGKEQIWSKPCLWRTSKSFFKDWNVFWEQWGAIEYFWAEDMTIELLWNYLTATRYKWISWDASLGEIHYEEYEGQ